jgi:hypothetical protein
LNGSRANVRILVNADINANCVTISFDVIQSLYEAAKSLIQDDKVSTAKEILEWIGIIGAPTGACLGLFQYLRARNGRQAEQQAQITDTQGNNIVQVTISGDGNTVNISPEVAKLAHDTKVIEAAQGVVQPVVERKGINSATFFVEGEATERIDKEYAQNVAEFTVMDEDPPETQTIVGHIRIYSPVFDPKAQKWRFIYNGHIELIDISGTTIAGDILKRGKIVVGDTWKVRMRITERRTPSGFKYEYAVIDVLDFHPGSDQSEMIFARDGNEEDVG